jgi:hypothetical protein
VQLNFLIKFSPRHCKFFCIFRGVVKCNVIKSCRSEWFTLCAFQYLGHKPLCDVINCIEFQDLVELYVFVLIISSSHVGLFVHPDWVVRPLWISGIVPPRPSSWHLLTDFNVLRTKYNFFPGTSPIQLNKVSLNRCQAATKSCFPYARRENETFSGVGRQAIYREVPDKVRLNNLINRGRKTPNTWNFQLQKTNTNREDINACFTFFLSFSFNFICQIRY